MLSVRSLARLRLAHCFRLAFARPCVRPSVRPCVSPLAPRANASLRCNADLDAVSSRKAYLPTLMPSARALSLPALYRRRRASPGRRARPTLSPSLVGRAGGRSNGITYGLAGPEMVRRGRKWIDMRPVARRAQAPTLSLDRATAQASSARSWRSLSQL